MSKTVSTCICETNLVPNRPQENVFFLTLSRKLEDFPNEFLRTARSTSPIQICAIFSTIGPDNTGAVLNLELNNELEKIVAQYSKQPVLDFDSFSNQVINVLNLKVCNFSVQKGIPFKVSMTMTVVEGDLLRVIHVGNTKAVLLRENKIMLLTEEQTVAHRYVQMGAITPEQEKTHSENMNLTQYLGKMPQDGQVVPDKKVHLKLKDNDELMLMGLGISREMPNQMRNMIIAKRVDTEVKAKELINSAVNYGIKAGLTLIVMKVESTFLLPGDAVINSDLNSAGEIAKPVEEKKEEKKAPYTEFPKGDAEKEVSSDDTLNFNIGNLNENKGEDIGEDDFLDNPGKEEKKKKGLPLFVKALIVFLVCAVVGFGVMYLVAGFTKIINWDFSSPTQETIVAAEMFVQEDNTPLYSQEDVASQVIENLNKGDFVSVLKTGDTFSEVRTDNDKTGFILNAALGENPPELTEDTEASASSETSASDTEETLDDEAQNDDEFIPDPGQDDEEDDEVTTTTTTKATTATTTSETTKATTKATTKTTTKQTKATTKATKQTQETTKATSETTTAATETAEQTTTAEATTTAAEETTTTAAKEETTTTTTAEPTKKETETQKETEKETQKETKEEKPADNNNNNNNAGGDQANGGAGQ